MSLRQIRNVDEIKDQLRMNPPKVGQVRRLRDGKALERINKAGLHLGDGVQLSLQASMYEPVYVSTVERPTADKLLEATFRTGCLSSGYGDK